MPSYYALDLTDLGASARQRVLLDGHDWVTGALSRASPRLAFQYGGVVGRLVGRLGLFGTKAQDISKLFGSLPDKRCQEIAQAINSRIWMTRAATRLMDRIGFDAFSPNIVSTCDDELLRRHRDRVSTILAFVHAGPFVAIAATLHRLEIPALIIAWNWRFHGATKLDVYKIGRGQTTTRWPFKRVVDKLRNGGMVTLSLDTPITTLTNVQLFGGPFAFARGPFAAARLSGASVVPITASWTSEQKIEIAMGEPICPQREPCRPSDHSKQEAEAYDQLVADHAAAWFERYFREHPERLSIGLLRASYNA